MFSEKQRRFNEDCAILESLPEAQKCDICDAFHALINLAVKAIHSQPHAKTPQLPPRQRCAHQREEP
jgi:hypothetical protein